MCIPILNRDSFILCLALALLAGCSSLFRGPPPTGRAALVMRDQHGGLVAYGEQLDGDHAPADLDSARKKAVTLMDGHCGARGSNVVQEGQVIVRRESLSQARAVAGAASDRSQEQQRGTAAVGATAEEKQVTTTKPIIESRIRYICGSAPSEYKPPEMTLNALP